jgi:hypothetical protein
VIAVTLQAEIRVDGRPAALLTIENAHTGSSDLFVDYRVTLDVYREARTLSAEIKRFPIAVKQRLDLLAEAFRVVCCVGADMNTLLPPAFAEATLIPLPDRTGYMALMPMEGLGVDCPSCADGRALGLAVLRQAWPSGRWSYCCLICDATAVESAVLEDVTHG